MIRRGMGASRAGEDGPSWAPFRAPLLALALALALPVAGCTGGTETGNPSFVAEVSYGAYSSDPGNVAVRETGQAVSVSAAWLVLGDARFVEAAGCSSEAPTAHAAPGLGVGNHAGATPASTEFELAEADYCRVELPFVLSTGETLPTEAPPELRGHSILIEGALGAGETFSLRSRAVPAVALAAESGSFAMSDAQASTLIGFDVATWLGEVDFAGATSTAGHIEISATSNAGLLDAFESRLASGVALFRDADGDGRLDPSPTRTRLAQGR